MLKEKFLFTSLILGLLIAVSAFTLQDNFIYSNGKQKITLIIGEGQQYLKWNETAKLKIIVEHIDLKKMSSSAPGLSLQPRIEGLPNQSNWKITVDRDHVKGDTLKLHINWRDKKNDFQHHEFKIPVRE